VSDAKAFREACAYHRFFRGSGLVAVIVFTIVGVGEIVRCRSPSGRYRGRQENSSGRINQALLPPTLLKTTIIAQPITKQALPDNDNSAVQREAGLIAELDRF
jgi:hypothetical protein